MAPNTINVLVSSFAGLSLPRTLSLPLSADTPIASLSHSLSHRLPTDAYDLVLSTYTRRIDPSSQLPISTLLTSDHDDDAALLSMRLSARLPGGKGGFGSQLRAAGGRMSSRKNRNRSQQEINGSNRNLDGRRLRTITEAKNLADYLALKPEMDRKEREERRKRWEAVVDLAERKEDELKKGKGNVRLDSEWVDAKEEAESKTREAVLAAMKAGLIGAEADAPMLERTGSESSADDQDSDAQPAASSSASSDDGKPPKQTPAPAATRSFYGWDEDDEFMSDDDEEEEEEEQAPTTYEGKGKAKA